MDPLKVLWVLTNSTYLVSKYMKANAESDRRPVFGRAVYQAEVGETAKSRQAVVTITAENHDKFPDISYEISGGNVGGAFAADTKTGEIYVVTSLDYETNQKYELVYSASAQQAVAYTSVVILVKDENDNPPVFEKNVYVTEVAEEDGRNLPRQILQVSATDGDRDQPADIVYFLAGQGVDPDDPATGNFAIDKATGQIFVLKPLDRDPPAGRPQWRFTAFAQDEAGKGLVGFADVQVKLKDINDNAPTFSQTTYVGNVTENGPKGLLVLTLDADDSDDPLENGNARIKYSIEKNAIEEGSGRPIFDVGEATGEVRTLICCLDRERTADYSIQVIAVDGAGLKGTGTVTIRVLDINDSAPVFTKAEWETEVLESAGDATLDPRPTPALTVAVRDTDLNNRFVYSVVERSGYGADRFRMVTNVDGTGSLLVAKPLDYEDPLQRNGFRFQIQVLDEDETGSHVAYSWVSVRLLDVNDNAPRVEVRPATARVAEDAPPGRVVARLTARDRDDGGRTAVRYSIDRQTDRRRLFHVSQAGELTVRRPLDRETVPRHLLRVLAVDGGYPPQTGTANVTVELEDVNDNAPDLASDLRPVVQENRPPGEAVEVRAVDPDDAAFGHGVPITFALDPAADPAVKAAFKVVQREDEVDTAKVVSLVTFDREERKRHLVPLVVTDAGHPRPRSATRTLTVVIGDTNDNSMRPGSMDVLAYVYRVHNTETPIGRVYVDDPDDWDLADKRFRWEGREHPRFRLDEATGALTMRAGAPRGTHELRLRATDLRRGQVDVPAAVRVRVRDLTHAAVANSGSLRLAGVTAVDFVMKRGGKSKLMSLQRKLAEVLQVSEDQVAIFSVQPVADDTADVRFTVSNFRQEVLNGLLAMHIDEIESAVGVNVTSVGVDKCVEERLRCEGSCTPRAEAGGPALVEANATVLAGVRVTATAECACGDRDYARPETCRSRPCLHGGRCIETAFGISCSCPGGFTGPRCQKTDRSFNGDGWAWYPPLRTCQNSHLSFEFLARKADGQMVYNGPVGPPKPGGSITSDFISVELVEGYPRLLLDYGSGTRELRLVTTTRLNDSAWHRLDIMWDTEFVELVVDSCLGVEGLSPPGSCRARGPMPPDSELLNLNTPLQLGGRHTRPFPPSLYRWTAVPYAPSFDGCIKNFFYNSRLYDLGGSGLSRGGADDCSGACVGCSALGGECVGSAREPRCACLPGRRGPTCGQATTPVTLLAHSYVRYSLAFEPGQHATELQLRFRTREESGELVRMGDTRSSQYAILEIVESRVRFRYRLSDSEKTELRISTVRINDGQWHTVKVFRAGSAVRLELDGGEGRRGNRTTDFASRGQLTVDTEEGLYLGGKPEHTEIGIIAIEQDYQEGCVDDVRLNGRALPLPPDANSTSWAEAVAAQNVARGCPIERLCGARPCHGAYQCWDVNRCLCGEGMVVTASGGCAPSDDCLALPCLRGGSCLEPEPGLFRCACPPGYVGPRCEVAAQRHALRLGATALATLLGCILLTLLVLVLMLVIYNRRRDSPDKKGLECDIRENIIKYNDDGSGGAGDLTAAGVAEGVALASVELSCHNLPADSVAETSLTELAEGGRGCTTPRDELHIYTFEGGGSDGSSLSSLSFN